MMFRLFSSLISNILQILFNKIRIFKFTCLIHALLIADNFLSRGRNTNKRHIKALYLCF